MFEKIKTELERKYKCNVDIISNNSNSDVPETQIYIRFLDVNRAINLVVADEDILHGIDSFIECICKEIEHDAKENDYNPLRGKMEVFR